MTRADAVQNLTRDAAARLPPVISNDDIEAMVDASARYGVAEVSTVYSAGQKVIPAAWNGRVYRVVVAGTSGDTAPSWPTASCCFPCQRITDGSVTWEDAGPAHVERYDYRKAKRDAFRMKARLCAHLVSFSEGPQRVEMDQNYKHWDAEARRLSGFYAV
jgi:hypothetical protein